MKYYNRRMFGLVLLFNTLLAGCTGLPDGIQPVSDFKLDRYLGTWYEIARLNHRFEAGLHQVTATYEVNEDGSVSVFNKGYSDKDQQLKEAMGKAKFVGQTDTGHLKVSFFGPFYGSYVIYELDPEYQFAFVTSYNKESLWFLSRTPTVDAALFEKFTSQATQLGFDLDELIKVRQIEPSNLTGS